MLLFKTTLFLYFRNFLKNKSNNFNGAGQTCGSTLFVLSYVRGWLF